MEYMKKIGFDFKPRSNVLTASKSNAALLQRLDHSVPVEEYFFADYSYDKFDSEVM
jgi:hypothetical protein